MYAATRGTRSQTIEKATRLLAGLSGLVTLLAYHQAGTHTSPATSGIKNETRQPKVSVR